MDAVTLPISVDPEVGKLDALISQLEALEKKGFTIPVSLQANLSGLQDQLSKFAASGPKLTVPVGIQMSGVGGQGSEVSTVLNSLMVKLKAVGETDAASKLGAGFKNAGAELVHVNNLYDEMTTKMRAAMRNPMTLTDPSKLRDWESVMNLLALRQEEVASSARSKMDEPRDKALFDQERSKRSRESGVGSRGSDAEARAVNQRKVDEQFFQGQQGAAKVTPQATAAIQAQIPVLNQSAAAWQRAANAAQQYVQQQQAAARGRIPQPARLPPQGPGGGGGGANPAGGGNAPGAGGLSGISATLATAAKFIAIYRGIDLALRGIEFGAESAIKFERQLATLQIVYRGTKEEARALSIEVLNQAAALGQDGVAALEVATDWARYGFTQSEILEAVRVSAIAANVAQLSLGDSSKALQSILSGYGLNVGQLSGVLGGLDTVSHSFNVTNKQLLDGLARVAPLAKQAGVGLNELIGFEAVISGRTARPGAEAGNAVKALIARLTKETTQTALSDAGVSATDDTGELKSASQVVNELFVSYQKLTAGEREELLVKVAGTQQAGRVAALMDGYLKSQELAIAASRDLGRAERENIAVRATLSSQLGTLSTEWQKFWISSAGSGAAGGLQSDLTEIVVNLSNMLALLSVIQNWMNSHGGKGGKSSGILGAIGEAAVDAFQQQNPLDLIGKFKQSNKQFDFLKDLFPKTFKTDTAQSTDGLIRLNAEVGKLQQLGQADEASSRFFKTVNQLINSASPEKLTEMLQQAAHIAAPGDLPGQEAIFSQLDTLAKAGNYQELSLRLSQLQQAAEKDRAKQLTDSQKLLENEINKQQELLKIAQINRSEAGRTDNKTKAGELDKEIDQRQTTIARLRSQAAGNATSLYQEGEEPYARDPINVDKIKQGIGAIARALAEHRASTKSGELDSELLVANLTFELEKKKIEAMQERGRVSRQMANDAISDLEKERNAERENIEFARQYADVIDKQARARKETALVGKSARGGESEAEDISRERERLIGRDGYRAEQRPTYGLWVKGPGGTQHFPGTLDRSGYVDPTPESTNAAYAAVDKTFDAKGRRIPGYGADEERGYQTVYSRAKVPEREQTTGIPLNIPAAREDVDKAKTQEEKLQALARLQEFGVRLEELATETLTRKLTLEAEITKEREKQGREASKNLLYADRETQLRAALAARLIQQRGGKGFSADEFSFLDQKDKQAVEKTLPGALPAEAQTKLSDLNREYAIAQRELSSYNATLAEGRKIQAEATKLMQDILSKFQPGKGADAGAGGAAPKVPDLTKTVDRGNLLIGGALDQLGKALEARDITIANGLTALAERISRVERGTLQSVIGRAQGAAVAA